MDFTKIPLRHMKENNKSKNAMDSLRQTRR